MNISFTSSGIPGNYLSKEGLSRFSWKIFHRYFTDIIIIQVVKKTELCEGENRISFAFLLKNKLFEDDGAFYFSLKFTSDTIWCVSTLYHMFLQMNDNNDDDILSESSIHANT